MKKYNLIISIALILTIMLISACSSEEIAKEKNTSTTIAKIKKVSEMTQVEKDDEFKKLDSEIKASVSDSCDSLKINYDKFLNTGDNNDGLFELARMRDQIRSVGSNVGGIRNSSSLLYLDEYDIYFQKLTEFVDTLWASGSEVQAFVESSYDKTLSVEKTNDIHLIVKKVDDYVDNSEYGPCSLIK